MRSHVDWRARVTGSIVVAAILSLALAVRLYQLDVQVVWFDEAYSVWLARMPIARAIFFTAQDVHPPLYYLLLHAWMSGFDDGVVAVRSLNVVLGVMTVAVGMLLAQRIASRRIAAMAGLLLAMFPIAVYYSQEARMYALLGLLMLSAAYMLVSWAQLQSSSYLLSYTLLMIAGWYTHYFAALGALVSWTYVLLARAPGGRRLISVQQWWFCNLVIVIAYLPWLPTLYEQIHENTVMMGWIAPVTLVTIPESLWVAFMLGTESSATGVMMVVFTVLVIAVAARVVRQNNGPHKPGALLVVYCFVPICVTWLFSLALPLFVERYLVFAFLGLPILLAMAMNGFRWKWQLALLIACLLFEGIGLTTLYNRTFNLRGGNQWVNNRLDYVMAQVAARWQAGDALLIEDRGGWSLTIDFYNNTGVAPLVFKEHEPDAASMWYPLNLDQVVTEPRTLASQYKRVWWVTSGEVTEIEKRMLQDWVKLEELDKGDSRALLFAMPEQSARIN
ncbi:glycosyltransferase family 39 protein [Pseudomonas fluorescens]|jgi:mannosyltransferase|uniref:glycosyltransferase family 39 protein n=1 Tax=Pseudomonas fluorescens TaxID=294 RepID=UPI0020C447D3|nr:glycosyltransferase family 39 protein [Pseudomonas fluorescens]UTL90086.1 glycosyltransferase family 39 protein [Pseudomonas fluorescens]